MPGEAWQTSSCPGVLTVNHSFSKHFGLRCPWVGSWDSGMHEADKLRSLTELSAGWGEEKKHAPRNHQFLSATKPKKGAENEEEAPEKGSGG